MRYNRGDRGAALAGAALLATFSLGLALPASGEELWSAGEGIVVVHLNTALLRELGIEVEVDTDAETSPEMTERMESPCWTFGLRTDSDLRFRVEHGIAVPYGLREGALRLDGSMRFLEVASGLRGDVHSPEILLAPATPREDEEGDDEGAPSQRLVLRDGPTGLHWFDLEHSMVSFRPKSRTLQLHYLNIHISRDGAARLGRPDLAGWNVGMAETIAAANLRSAAPPSGPLLAPEYGDTVDVSLGLLRSISYVAREGTYPTGRVALSMATTACNVGHYDVPWFAPMLEDHPVIAMALYRLHEGRLEQIGISDLKHGFYALSHDDCQTCQNPSNGTYLGVGCSDTYGVSNNGDRNYLAPRDEVNPFTAEWKCQGSHFAGGQPDCERRHGGNGHGPLEHRLQVADVDLGLPGAEYFYEAYYLVRRDHNRGNNIGSRRCTMTREGNTWTFSTPSANNPIVYGPAIERFGEMRTTASVGPADGDYTLAVQTTDLGGGMWRYEYALFNLDSDLQVRSFRLPVGEGTDITAIGFHDGDSDPANDWAVTLESGLLTWEVADGGDEEPNTLRYGRMYNFRFDAPVAPGDVQAVAGLYKPSIPDQIGFATRGPSVPSSVVEVSAAGPVRFHPVRPNPLGVTSSIGFDLPAPAPVRLEVFDLQGRLVRGLVDARLEPGTHQALWDGRDAGGNPVGSGVYYCRLIAGGHVGVRSVVVIR